MPQRRPVVKISPEFDVLGEYSWSGEAAVECGVSKEFVVTRINDKKRSVLLNEFGYGYSFRFADDPEFVKIRNNVRKIRNKAKEYVMDHVSEQDLLILMMEECSEMAQSCSKRYRSITQGNPTSVKPSEAIEMMNEEAGDILMIFELWGYVPEGTTDDNPKWMRWAIRLGYKENQS